MLCITVCSITSTHTACQLAPLAVVGCMMWCAAPCCMHQCVLLVALGHPDSYMYARPCGFGTPRRGTMRHRALSGEDALS